MRVVGRVRREQHCSGELSLKRIYRGKGISWTISRSRYGLRLLTALDQAQDLIKGCVPFRFWMAPFS